MSYIADRGSRNLGLHSSAAADIRRALAWIGISLLLGATTHAMAAVTSGSPTVAQVVHARRDHFHALGKATKSLRQQLGRSTPDWGIIEADTSQIERLATALPNWFPAGSGRGHGVKTKARSNIWAKPRQFAQAAQDLSRRAQDLAFAAARHDPRTLKLRARALGQACGNCHHQFRAHSSWW